MRWVETETYEGPDRRLRRLWRLIERRRQDQSTPLPSLATKLRQLRVQASSTHLKDGRESFLRHAVATRALADLLNQQDAVQGLEDVITIVSSMDLREDPRAVADTRLARIAERLILTR